MKILSARFIILTLSLILFIGVTAEGVRANPFTHGVASGDVTDDSAIIWTRAEGAASVDYLVHTSDTFNAGSFVAGGTVAVPAGDDHTVKILLDEILDDGTRYYYKFISGGDESALGTFTTAPQSYESVDLSLAYSADTDARHLDPDLDWGFNGFDVLGAVQSDQPDVFVHLGDTIYADSGFRSPAATSLTDYWTAYKENLSVSNLQNLRAAVPFIDAWDDHEVRDNWAGDSVGGPYPWSVPQAQFDAARQAYLNYSTVNEDVVAGNTEDATCADKPLLRVFHWGKDVDIIVLDERSCRSESTDVAFVCTPPGSPFPDLAPTAPLHIRLLMGDFLAPQPPEGCLEALYNPDRTLLGETQLQTLKDTLSNSTAKYKLILNQVAIQQMLVFPYDRWEGYPVERADLLNFIRTEQIKNVIFLTTDQHTNLMNQVFVNRWMDAKPVAYEAVTGPISTFSWEEEISIFLGPELGQAGVDAFNFLTNLTGADCRNNDTDAYGLFEFNARNGAASITLKDANGDAVHDDSNPVLTCRKNFLSPPVGPMAKP